jgi:DeoR/GlpR family transcriptional regulator of sugar metabolism
MSEPLFVEERRRAILDELRKNGRVSVKTLSDAMHVSTVTIRQDLRSLEESGLLERTYGGAVTRTDDNILPELSFHTRHGRHRQSKQAIARRAASLVRSGDTIALDCSTTAYALVPFLKPLAKLTVLTNSLITAQSFLDSPHIEVLVPAGRLRRDSISLVGQADDLMDINLNIAFLGTRGVTLGEGFSDVDRDEIIVKHAMIERAVQSVILADVTKWGQVAAYTFARPEEIDRIITTRDAPETMVRGFRQAGLEVDLVQLEGPHRN